MKPLTFHYQPTKENVSNYICERQLSSVEIKYYKQKTFKALNNYTLHAKRLFVRAEDER